MKVLTATSRTQGARPGDFCHAIEGELVLLGWVCGCAGGSHPGGTCGCGRAFTGANSRLASTTAMVRDLELSVDDVRLAVEAHLVAAGTGPEVLGADVFADHLEETVGDVVRTAGPFPVGTVLERRLDSVHCRQLGPVA